MELPPALLFSPSGLDAALFHLGCCGTAPVPLVRLRGPMELTESGKALLIEIARA